MVVCIVLPLFPLSGCCVVSRRSEAPPVPGGGMTGPRGAARWVSRLCCDVGDLAAAQVQGDHGGLELLPVDLLPGAVLHHESPGAVRPLTRMRLPSASRQRLSEGPPPPACHVSPSQGHRKSWLAVLAVTALYGLDTQSRSRRWPTGTGGQKVRDTRAGPARIFVERDYRCREPGQGDPAGRHGPAPAGAGLRRTEGRSLRFWGASLGERQRTVYSVPLSGESPSLTFSWEDGLGQAGAVTLKDGQIPYPLPSAEGELCRFSVASLGWTPGSVEGTVASECVAEIEEAISLQTVAGHRASPRRR